MKLTELIPYIKDTKKWDKLLAKYQIDDNCEDVLVYTYEKLSIDSEILLIELEKTEDNMEITIGNKKYIQFLPYSLAYDLINIDFSNLQTDLEVAKRLLEYRINDA